MNLDYFFNETPMNAAVACQFGMERSGEMLALLDQDRVALICE